MNNVTEYSPFPYGFRGDEKDGAYCEISISDDETKFIVIRPRTYMQNYERENQLVVQGIVTWAQIYPELEMLGYMPKKDEAFWLYSVDICYIDKEFLLESDSETFAHNAKNCEEYVFDDFYKCMEFLKEKHAVEASDFHKSWETNYPQY